MVGPLFSSDAWNNVTFTAGELRDPKRNLPLSLGSASGGVHPYIACNFIYLSVLTLPQIQTAPEDRVPRRVSSCSAGRHETHGHRNHDFDFGCCNGMIMSRCARLFHDGAGRSVLQTRGHLNPVHRTPAFALVIQCGWAILLTLSGQYNDLLDYVIFAVLLFYILMIGGLFRLRRTRPDPDRPYRAVGYPVLPALYMLVAGVMEILLLINKPAFTVRGLILVLLGVPVYFLWRKKEVRA